MCASSTAGANGTPAGCWSWGDRRIAIGPKNPERDTELRSRLKHLAAKRMRFGYRRLTVLLAREGMAANHKRVYRLYREERLDPATASPAVERHGHKARGGEAEPNVVYRFRQRLCE